MNLSSLTKTLRGSLALQVCLAVILGLVVGEFFPGGEVKGWTQFGKWAIHWVKVLAGPYLFLTIVASVAEAQVEWRHGRRVIAIALLNMMAALTIGYLLAHFFLMRDGAMDLSSIQAKALGKTPTGNLTWEAWIQAMSPASIFEPFVKNDILLIALLALLIGVALRRGLVAEGPEVLAKTIRVVERLRGIAGQLLTWLIHLIPFAVFFLIAGTISEHGMQIVGSLGYYVVVVIFGFLLQVGLVYGSWIFVYARVSPKTFWHAARIPISYAFGVNSSLATLPLTLKALDDLGVSRRASSLGAGIATNLNNDGIILYEAMAVFFIAHLHGIHLGPIEMILVALTCAVAALGITGIPDAGFISLSVVITTLGYPTEFLPLLLAVDWIVARGRSVVNVCSDMTLSIALDAGDRR